MVVYNRWTGMVDWNGGLEWWTGIVDWKQRVKVVLGWGGADATPVTAFNQVPNLYLLETTPTRGYN